MKNVFKLVSSLEMNDIKYEDAKAFDAVGAGSVSGAAVIVDGATGFQKDIDKDGNIVKLPDITEGKYSSARIWADSLAEKLLKNIKKDNCSMSQALIKSIEEASNEMPIIKGDFETFQTPSSTFIAVRIVNGIFEVIASGDCGIIIGYKNRHLETIMGSPVLEEIRAERAERIKRENPEIDKLKADEKAKIQYRYMKETRQNLGNYEKGYFVPHYNGMQSAVEFLSNLHIVSEDNNRKIEHFGRGDIWILSAEASKIKSFMISSDGFIEKVIKNGLLPAKKLLETGRSQKVLEQIGADLRALESGSTSDVGAVTMKIINNKKAYTGSSDDVTAMCIDIL